MKYEPEGVEVRGLMSFTQNASAENMWALTGELDPARADFLGRFPGRWGRMTPLCRLMIYKVGKLLHEHKIFTKNNNCAEQGLVIGIIGATQRGSLQTDQEFLQSMQQGPGLASPALFGYTLANIPLAEAASQYGLVGPVYALFHVERPLSVAIEEVELLFMSQVKLTHMIACEFDHYQKESGSVLLDVTLKLIQRNA